MKKVLLALFIAGALVRSVPAAPVLDVIPANGVVGGQPGDTVGWGFTLTNTENYLIVTGSSFEPASPLGTYEDYISTGPLIIVGPAPESPIVSQVFDMALRSGVGAFHINSNAPPFAMTNGALVINYSLYSRSPNDPDFNPDTDLRVADANLSQGVTVFTPEPGSFLLLTAAAIPFAPAWRRRRR